jgi:hypothetical protein
VRGIARKAEHNRQRHKHEYPLNVQPNR